MPGISPAIKDVCARLQTLQVVNQDLQTVPLYARVFNNQIKRQQKGLIEAHPLPAAFVEVQNNAQFNRLLNGVSESDLVFRIHLQHWFNDAQDGTFDQDYDIFDLRDDIIELLSDYRPTACGNMCLTAEGQDYDHDNVYVYILEFTTGFIDSKGSKYDIGRTEFINSIPPLTLQLIINSDEVTYYWNESGGYYVVTSGTGTTFTAPLLIGKTGYAVYVQQLNNFLTGYQISYNIGNGSFTILVPNFQLLPGFVVLVYPNKFDTDIPLT